MGGTRDAGAGRGRLADAVALARPGLALADAVPFAAGGLAITHPRVGTVLLLTLGGVLLSIHGRLLDALGGLPADRLNPARRASPLVRGRVRTAPVAAGAGLAGLAVMLGALLLAPTVTRGLGFALLVAARTSRTTMRRVTAVQKASAAWWLADAVVATLAPAAGVPLGVLAAGGRPGLDAFALAAGFALGAAVTGATVIGLRDLPIDRLTGRLTTALVTGVRLRRPSGFVFPSRYVLLVCAAQAGLLVAVAVVVGVGLADDPGLPTLGHGLAACSALAAALVAAIGLAHLLRSGAPGLDPVHRSSPPGGGFALVNLLACHLAAIAWLLTTPGDLPWWTSPPILVGWTLTAALWARPR
ncbi:4-hydroxybenzoate polyprenyltransferase [Frankia sp. R82]|uniref:4-hydroxybenzoate polyprenyltransferase n=1 Tax=Frankia sp. R82 TaxID=2950553 RepID=UPI002043CF00|nr:4-hydroxybenzoate polyprenyltransferase [Frankia sp. R82]MCM3883315.1 4-hydroxybenzoate polyprenyltransferase [Frankia sp. R82]